MSTATATIQRVEVPEAERLALLSKHVGTGIVLIEFEHRVYGNLASLCETYQGAFWEFYELSNRGLYMAPTLERELILDCPGNGFNGAVSADAAGIVATLYTLSQMASIYVGKPVGTRCADNYHRLLAFVDGHPQARSIFGAID
jgi:hypothetical protein